MWYNLEAPRLAGKSEPWLAVGPTGSVFPLTTGP